ncbi:MAG: dihydropteroate synthase [Pseudomonadota bacterium]
MGIVNVTPDSFSDGGQLTSVKAARDHALRLVRDGADVLDIGGESTRPGADPVSEAEEISRVVPVVEALRRETDALISVDTMKPGVARAAVAAGASTWNDVSALSYDADGPAIAAALGTPVVLMHMQGAPRTMQASPHYDDVVAEVIAFLAERASLAQAAGVSPDKIWVDPGIGFGKTLEHNLALIRATSRIKAETGKPLLFGASRKSFIAKIDSSATDPKDRLGGSLAAALFAADAGADMLRVHDVRETTQALALAQSLR